MIHAAVEQFIPAGVAGTLRTVVLFRFAPESLWVASRACGRSFSASASSPLAVRCHGRCSRRRCGIWPPASPAWPGRTASTHFAVGHGGPLCDRTALHGSPCSIAAAERTMPKNSPKKEQAGRFAYDGLDRVIHEKARLSVLTSLVAHPKGLVFGDLKQMCGLTDGNLSRHLQVLEEAGLIAAAIEKGLRSQPPANGVPDHAGPGGSASSTIWPALEQVVPRRRKRRQSRFGTAKLPPVEDSLSRFIFFVLGDFAMQSTFHSARWPPRRHHHGRQRTLGHAPRSAAVGRARCRRPGGPPRRRIGARARRAVRSRCSPSPPTIGGARATRLLR